MARYYIHYKDNVKDILSILPTRKVEDIHTSKNKRNSNVILHDSVIQILELELTIQQFTDLKNRGVEIEIKNIKKPEPLFDPPGTDYITGLPFPNQYAKLTNNTTPYPSTPYRTEYYHPFNGPMNFSVPLVWNHNFSCCTVPGTAKLINPNQFYLDVPRLWSLGYSGQGIKVCVIDTAYSGIPMAHEHITVQGINFDPTGLEYTIDPARVIHSLGRISEIAARPTTGSGVIGTAYNADIYSADYSYTGEAFSWGLSQGCRIFNCSFMWDPDLYTRKAMKRILDNGGVIVVSAGNNIGSTPITMNALTGVKGVASVACLNGGGVVAYNDILRYNTVLPVNGVPLQFAVPGFTIAAAFDPSDISNSATYYKFGIGSSEAAAQLSGLFALLMEAYPNDRGEVLMNRLKRTGRSSTQYGVTFKIPNASFVKHQKGTNPY